VAIRAAAENREAARLLGIPATRVSVFTWVAGSILAGIAGLLITEVRGSLDIASLSTGFLIRALAVALLGGLTSLPGAMLGGLAVGISEAFLKLVTNDQPGVPEVLLFAVVFLVLLFRPGGVFGQTEQTEDKVAFVPAMRELAGSLQRTVAARMVRFVGFALALLVCLSSLLSGARTNAILTQVVLYGMVGVSLTVLMGYSGQVSLGQWGIAGVGAFSIANLYMRFHVPFLLALPLVFFVGMFLSSLIGLGALRIRGLYLAVVTLGFNLAAEFFLFRHRLIGESTGGIIINAPKLGPLDLDDPTGRPLFFFSVACLALMMVLARNLARSRTGRGFFALRENEKAAATLGVDLTKYKLLSFAISGGIAALAGALFATHLGRAVYSDWETGLSLVLVAMVMIGGLGSMTGAVLGAFLVFGLPSLVQFENPWIVPIGTGLLLIIVIVRLRGGLGGIVRALQEDLIKSLNLLMQPPTPPPAEGKRGDTAA
jgi:ABC-type branched-subunit amino acid transport system permease subunit